METKVEQKNELALLVEKSGLEVETAKSLQEIFQPFLDQAIEWNEKAKTIKVTDATQLIEIKQARDARLAMKGIRTAVENRRKELKEDSLRKGKAIDGVANFLKGLIEPTEAYLQEQEDFAKIAEAKRLAELKATREEELRPFGVTTEFYDLAKMDEQTYGNLYHNSKKTYEDGIAAAKKAEEERIASEQAEAKERERIQLENEELKRKQEEQERLLREERMKAEQERKAAEEAARKEREEAEKKLASERAERARVESELKAKEEAEAQAKAAVEAATEAEAAKGDKQKFQDLINAMEALKGKYTFKSKKYKDLGASVDGLLDKTINWAISKQ